MSSESSELFSAPSDNNDGGGKNTAETQPTPSSTAYLPRKYVKLSQILLLSSTVSLVHKNGKGKRNTSASCSICSQCVCPVDRRSQLQVIQGLALLPELHATILRGPLRPWLLVYLLELYLLRPMYPTIPEAWNFLQTIRFFLRHKSFVMYQPHLIPPSMSP
jgi:hypothetical protein